MRGLRVAAALSLMLFIAILLPGPVSAAAAPSGGPTDLQEFASFADQIMTEQMERYRIPGAALVVVRDGAIFYAKGYGYADLERQIPWDPERTVLRARSISKLVTATAAMQLYEQGLLELDTDVNDYLVSYKVPPTFAQPVTLANLLTHTGGFADRGVATNVTDAADLMPLEQYLALNRYPRLYPPGDRISYGDHGPTMIAAVVENVSGQPFPQYVADHIFAPLHMRRSTFQQPYPEPLARDMAMGYIDLVGRYRPQPAGYTQVYPAAGMLTTAADMGRFMLAHLEDGRYGGSQILSAGTIREMHRQQFTQHPKLPGLAYGFWEEFTHGRRALMHAGEGLGFANWLYLLPAERIGFFISTNRRDFTLHQAFTTAFLDRYFPSERVPPRPMAGYQDRAARYAGVYQFLRHDPRMIEKVNAEEVIIRANRDGTLTASFSAGRWVEVEPLLFQRVDGEGLLAFRADSRGQITGLFTDHWPWAFQKGHWYDAKGFRIALLAVSLLIFLSALILWPIGAWRKRRVQPHHEVQVAGLAWLTAGVTSLLNLIFVALLAPTLIVDSQGGAVPVLNGLPPVLAGALIIPLITTALTMVVPIFAVVAWKRRFWLLGGRIHYTLVAMAAAAFVWSLAYLNLIGFHY